MIYKDSTATNSQRVADLLGRMTTDEKLAQLGAQWLILDENGAHQDRELEMASQHSRKSIKERLKHGLGQITRPLGTHVTSPQQGVAALNELQRYLVEETRLGIPAISHEECLVGLMSKDATLYPSSLNFGHTWNPELIEEMAADIGRQVKAVGAHQGLAPVLDVSRDVRWGRTEETLGEDPYHVGIMATSYVKGLQGERREILATLKHYVGHSFSEGARNHAPVHLGFKELNDTFMLPFEMAVKLANASSIMPAYHDIDGEPCHSSEYLLTDVLRHQWGFDGLIVADYGGVDLLRAHHAVATNEAEAAALAFNAGLDIELPDDACVTHLKTALDNKLISHEKLDEIVTRILTKKFELGLFERPYCPLPTELLSNETSKSLAYKVASESIVLLKNDGTLPLERNNKVAIIGATTDDQLALLGGYSFPVHLILSSMESDEKVAKTLKEALGERFKDTFFTKGCEILTERHANAPVFPGDVDLALSQIQTSPISMDTSMLSDVDAQLAMADTAIVCVGDLAGLFQTGTVGEGSDVDSLDLPGVQQAVIDRALDSGKPVVVVVTGGRPYNLGRAEHEAAAILYGWAPGQEGADAIADIITGKVNPSGKLTISIPKSVGAVPYYYNHKLKSGGTPIAYHFGSQFNFGFGLSYTTFDYSDFKLVKSCVEQNDTIEVQCTLTNVGDVAGDEVVQLYVRDVYSSLVRPVRELKGFVKTAFEPGESKTITFSLPVDLLNFTNNKHQRIVEPGDFDIMIGRSSDDIVFKETVTVTGQVRVLPQQWRMVCETHVSAVDKATSRYAELV
ncbi:glycoside hydrolase family 3 N-terminal domain-containing protein [Vibrio sp. 10N.286.49.B1]|uniref:glycoside hydrolase family 3 N-terminal domain-containing protein n=1 Tax=unclassified Vibrio TaxID=2614977 RepID=UPI001F52C297|nr:MULTISPECIES: glycoside hydrolase family 3 N-terminal domain-containing protein [unclassified Vibrio]